MAMKSIRGTILSARTMSARKGTLPLSTATSTTPSVWASEISPATRVAAAPRSSAEKRTGGGSIGSDPGLLALDVLPQRLAEHGRPQALAQAGQVRQGVGGLAAGLGVALLEHGHHDLLEEARLPL